MPPALSWRWERIWQPVGRSDVRRAGEGRAVWAVRTAGARGRMSAKPLQLRFANAHAARLRELEWFAEEVDAASEGNVTIRFLNTWTTADNPREETATVAAVGRNWADLGWAGTRAFGCLGVRSLDPLQTPFLFERYESLAAVCNDDLATEMLEPLERLQLVGLVVLPGPLRKPFSFARRLLSARDYEGAKLRIHESLVAESTYRALGAEAVTLSVRQMAGNPSSVVDGLDLQVEALAGWGLRGSITYNVNLWPRTLAIAASQRTYRWLGAPERDVLDRAARRTLERALVHLADQEQRDHLSLPPTVTALFADDDQLAELRRRVEPVRAELRTHPETHGFLERMESLVKKTGVAAR